MDLTGSTPGIASRLLNPPHVCFLWPVLSVHSHALVPRLRFAHRTGGRGDHLRDRKSHSEHPRLDMAVRDQARFHTALLDSVHDPPRLVGSEHVIPSLDHAG